MILDAKVRLVQNSAVKVDLTKQRTVIKSGLEKTCSLQKNSGPSKKKYFQAVTVIKDEI